MGDTLEFKSFKYFTGQLAKKAWMLRSLHGLTGSSILSLPRKFIRETNAISTNAWQTDVNTSLDTSQQEPLSNDSTVAITSIEDGSYMPSLHCQDNASPMSKTSMPTGEPIVSMVFVQGKLLYHQSALPSSVRCSMHHTVCLRIAEKRGTFPLRAFLP